jgi:hypothetical protein
MIDSSPHLNISLVLDIADKVIKLAAVAIGVLGLVGTIARAELTLKNWSWN